MGPASVGVRPSPNSLPCTLTDLNADVLRLIARWLDRSDAVALSMSCSAIRPIAEQTVWSELNISVHRTFMPGATSWNQHRPLGGNRLFTIREEHIWGGLRPTPTDVHFTDTHNTAWRNAGRGSGFVPSTKVSALEQYYLDLLAHLQADSNRLTSVQSIFLDVDLLLSPLFADLLRLVSSTLRSLHLNPPGFPYGSAEDAPTVSIREIFDRLHPNRLDRLRTLYLPIGNDWNDTVCVALRAAPNVSSLTIAVEQPYSGSWGESAPFPAHPMPVDGWPGLENLKDLVVKEMASALDAFLSSLIRSAPDLKRVTLQDPGQAWQPSATDELLETLACKTGLTYLACPRSALVKDVKGKYNDLLELAIAEDRQPWGLPQLEVVAIPALPTLQALYSYARINEARSITWAWEGESRGLPSALRPINPMTLSAIQTAPSLLYIQMPGSPTKEFGLPSTDDEWDYWGGRACLSRHDRAVLVRTYEHPKTGEVFTHCRSFSAHHSHIEDGVIHRTEAMWEEHVDYGGHCIPAGVLGEVYEAMEGTDGNAGGGAGWKVPGRRLSMPDSAWAVLRCWLKNRQADECVE